MGEKIPAIFTPSIPEDTGGTLDLQAKALGLLPHDLHLGEKVILET